MKISLFQLIFLAEKSIDFGSFWCLENQQNLARFPHVKISLFQLIFVFEK